MTHEEECELARKEIAGLFGRCGRLIEALGDETRRSIVAALLGVDGRGMRVGQITEETNLSRPAVSHHLRVLKDAGAVAVRKQGTMNFYYLNAASEQWALFRALADSVYSAAQRAREAANGAGDEKNGE